MSAAQRLDEVFGLPEGSAVIVLISIVRMPTSMIFSMHRGK